MGEQNMSTLKFMKTVWLSRQKSCNTTLSVPLSVFADQPDPDKKLFTLVCVPSMQLSSEKFPSLVYYKRLGDDPNSLNQTRLSNVRIIYSLKPLDSFPVIDTSDGDKEYGRLYEPHSTKDTSYGTYSLGTTNIPSPAALDDVMVILYNFLSIGGPSEEDIGTYMLFSSDLEDNIPKDTFSFESKSFSLLALFHVNVVGCARTVVVDTNATGDTFSIPIPPILGGSDQETLRVRLMHQREKSDAQSKKSFSVFTKDLEKCYENVDWNDILGDVSKLSQLILEGDLRNTTSPDLFEQLSEQQKSIAELELGTEQSIRITLWMLSQIDISSIRGIRDWDDLWNRICPPEFLLRDIPISETEIDQSSNEENRKALKDARDRALKSRQFFEWLVGTFKRVKIYYLSSNPIVLDSGEQYSQYEYVGDQKGYDVNLIESISFSSPYVKRGLYLVQYARDMGDSELSGENWVDFYFLEVIPMIHNPADIPNLVSDRKLYFLGNIPNQDKDDKLLKIALELRHLYSESVLPIGITGYEFGHLIPSSESAIKGPREKYDLSLQVSGEIEQEHRVGLEGALYSVPKTRFRFDETLPWKEPQLLGSNMENTSHSNLSGKSDRNRLSIMFDVKEENEGGVSALGVSYARYFRRHLGDYDDPIKHIRSENSDNTVYVDDVLELVHKTLDQSGSTRLFETHENGLRILDSLLEYDFNDGGSGLSVYSVLKSEEDDYEFDDIWYEYADKIVLGNGNNLPQSSNITKENESPQPGRLLLSISCKATVVGSKEIDTSMLVRILYEQIPLTDAQIDGAILSIENASSAKRYLCDIGSRDLDNILTGDWFSFECDGVTYFGVADSTKITACLREIIVNNEQDVLSIIDGIKRRVTLANSELKNRLHNEMLHEFEKKIDRLNPPSGLDRNVLDHICHEELKRILAEFSAKLVKITHSKPATGVYFLLGSVYVSGLEHDRMEWNRMMRSAVSGCEKNLEMAYSLYRLCSDEYADNCSITLRQLLSANQFVESDNLQKICQFLGRDICSELGCVGSQCDCGSFPEIVQDFTFKFNATLLEEFSAVFYHEIRTDDWALQKDVREKLWAIVGRFVDRHENSCLLWNKKAIFEQRSTTISRTIGSITRMFKNALYRMFAYVLWIKNSNHLDTSSLDKSLSKRLGSAFTTIKWILKIFEMIHENYSSRIKFYSCISVVWKMVTGAKLQIGDSSWDGSIAKFGDLVLLGQVSAKELDKCLAGNGLLFEQILPIIGKEKIRKAVRSFLTDGCPLDLDIDIIGIKYLYHSDRIPYPQIDGTHRSISWVVCFNQEPTKNEPFVSDIKEEVSLIGAKEGSIPESSEKIGHVSDVIRNISFHLLANSGGSPQDKKYTFFNGMLVCILVSTKGKTYRYQIEERLPILEKLSGDLVLEIPELGFVVKSSESSVEERSVYQLSVERYSKLLKFIQLVDKVSSVQFESSDLQDLKSSSVQNRPSLELEKYLGLVDDSRRLKTDQTDYLQSVQNWTIILDNLLLVTEIPQPRESTEIRDQRNSNTRIIQDLRDFTVFWETPAKSGEEFRDFIQFPLYVDDSQIHNPLLTQTIFGGYSDLCDSRFEAYAAYCFQVEMKDTTSTIFFKIDNEGNQESGGKSSVWIRLTSEQIETLEQISKETSSWFFSRKLVQKSSSTGEPFQDLPNILTLSQIAVESILREMITNKTVSSLVGWYNNRLKTFGEKLQESLKMRNVALLNLESQCDTTDAMLFVSSEKDPDEQFSNLLTLFSSGISKSVRGLSSVLADTKKSKQQFWYLSCSGHKLLDPFGDISDRYTKTLGELSDYLDQIKPSLPDPRGKITTTGPVNATRESLKNLISLPNALEPNLEEEIDARILVALLFGIISDSDELLVRINTSNVDHEFPLFNGPNSNPGLGMITNYQALEPYISLLSFGGTITAPPRIELDAMKDQYKTLLDAITHEHIGDTHVSENLTKITSEWIQNVVTVAVTENEASRIFSTDDLDKMVLGLSGNLSVIYDLLRPGDAKICDGTLSNHASLYWVVNRKNPALMYQIFSGRGVACELSGSLLSLAVPVLEHVFDTRLNREETILEFETLDGFSHGYYVNLVITPELLQRSRSSLEELVRVVSDQTSDGYSHAVSNLHALGYWNVGEFDVARTLAEIITIVEISPITMELGRVHRIKIIRPLKNTIESTGISIKGIVPKKDKLMEVDLENNFLYERSLKMIGSLVNLKLTRKETLMPPYTASMNGLYYLLVGHDGLYRDFDNSLRYMCAAHSNVVERSLWVLDNYLRHVAKSPFSTIPLFTEDILTHMVMSLWYDCDSTSERFIYYRIASVLLKECKDVLDLLVLDTNFSNVLKSLTNQEACTRFFTMICKKYNLFVPMLVGWDTSESFRFSQRKNYPMNLFLTTTQKTRIRDDWCRLVARIKHLGHDEYALDFVLRILSGRLNGLCKLQELIIKDHADYYGNLDMIYDEKLLPNEAIWTGIIEDIMTIIIVPLVLNLSTLDDSELLVTTSVLINSRLKLALFRFLVDHSRIRNVRHGIDDSSVPDRKTMDGYIRELDYSHLMKKVSKEILYNLEPIDGTAHFFSKVISVCDARFKIEHPTCSNYSRISPLHLFSFKASVESVCGEPEEIITTEFPPQEIGTDSPLNSETEDVSSLIGLPKHRNGKDPSDGLDVVSRIIHTDGYLAPVQLIDKQKIAHTLAILNGTSRTNDSTDLSKKLEQVYTRSMMFGLSDVPIICDLASGSCQSDTFQATTEIDKQIACELARIWLYALKLYQPELSELDGFLEFGEATDFEIPPLAGLSTGLVPVGSTALRNEMVEMYALEVLFRNNLRNVKFTLEMYSKWEEYIIGNLVKFATLPETDIGIIQRSIVQFLGFVRDGDNELENRFGRILSVLGYQKLLRSLYKALAKQYEIIYGGDISQSGVSLEKLERFILEYEWMLSFFDLKNCMETPDENSKLDASWYLISRYSHQKLVFFAFSDSVSHLVVDADLIRRIWEITREMAETDMTVLLDDTCASIIDSEITSKIKKLDLPTSDIVLGNNYFQELWKFTNLCLDTRGQGLVVFLQYDDPKFVRVPSRASKFSGFMKRIFGAGQESQSELLDQARRNLNDVIYQFSRLRDFLSKWRWAIRLVQVLNLEKDESLRSVSVWENLELWRHLARDGKVLEISSDLSVPTVTPSILSNITDMEYYQMDLKLKIRQGLQFLLPLSLAYSPVSDLIGLPVIEAKTISVFLGIELEYFLRKTIKNMVVQPDELAVGAFFDALVDRNTGSKYDLDAIIVKQADAYPKIVSGFSFPSGSDLANTYTEFMGTIRFMNQFLQLSNLVTKIYQCVFRKSSILYPKGIYNASGIDRKLGRLLRGSIVFSDFDQNIVGDSDFSHATLDLARRQYSEITYDLVLNNESFDKFSQALTACDVVSVQENCQQYVGHFSDEVSGQPGYKIMEFMSNDPKLSQQEQFTQMLALVRTFIDLISNLYQ